MEILAPAGRMDSLKAAIIGGCDAVYLGGKNFNARRNAENFGQEEILEAIDYAHLRGKKVYLTLNTLIKNEEINMLLSELEFISRAGFDGLILQDLGALNIVKKVLPQMPLHASTQMSAHSVSDCQTLKELGFKRVVLARELSLDEIINISNSVDIELEVFVHGALCMSISGQCFFSSALGERSANRGLCGGPCRLPFYAKNKDNYNLSLKDLSYIHHLNSLKEANITSIKIEGRMKRAEYVFEAVSAIKHTLDNKAYNLTNLEKVFSRSGFTDGYLHRDYKNITGVRTEDNKSESQEVLEPIRKNFAKETPSVPLTMEYSFKRAQASSLLVYDNMGNFQYVEGAYPESSISTELTKEQVELSLQKLGGTVYRLEDIHGQLEPNLFLPTKEIKDLRRKAIDELNKKRTEKSPLEFKPFNLEKMTDSISPSVNRNSSINHMANGAISVDPLASIKSSNIESSNIEKLDSKNKNNRPHLISSVSNISQLTEELLLCSDFVAIPLFQIKDLSLAFKERFANKIIAEIPRIYYGAEKLILNELSSVKTIGIDKGRGHTVGRLHLLNSLGFHIYGGFGLNLMNQQAISILEENFNFSSATLSPEISASSIKTLDKTFFPNTSINVIGYGHLPLMIARVCPIKEEVSCENCKNKILKDRKGFSFPICCYNKEIFEILNMTSLYIGNKKDKFQNVDSFELMFKEENSHKCLEIFRSFSQGQDIGQVTYGCYFRKVL